MWSDQFANAALRLLGAPLYLTVVYELLTMVPFAIATATLHLLVKKALHLWSGLLLGLILGAWASACWMTIPYVGAYPNLPWLILARNLGADDSPQLDMYVIAFSLTGCAVVGGIVGWLVGAIVSIGNRWFARYRGASTVGVSRDEGAGQATDRLAAPGELNSPTAAFGVLDTTLRETNKFMLIFLAVCCDLAALSIGLVGIMLCKDSTARSNAVLLVRVGVIRLCILGLLIVLRLCYSLVCD